MNIFTILLKRFEPFFAINQENHPNGLLQTFIHEMFGARTEAAGGPEFHAAAVLL